MKSDPYADQLDARMRAADARLDELEASARARNAQAEMDEITGLRKRRDRVRRHLADVRQQASADSQTVREQLSAEWNDFRQAIADAHSRYTDWDAAREQRFNAHMDEVGAILKRSTAEDAIVAADARASIDSARNELRTKLDAARTNYNAWRERRNDEMAMKNLRQAEFELDEAFDDYAVALNAVRGTRK
ncbi:MAG TPA: hypothetical protein VIP11_22255 [Gemmatimonadaceae bacterium]